MLSTAWQRMATFGRPRGGVSVATCRQTVVRKNKIFEEVGFDVTLRTPEWNSIDMNLWRFGDEN